MAAERRWAIVLSVAAACVLQAQQRTASVEAYAQVQALNAALLSSGSATRTLAAWCGDHHLADTPRIVAHRDGGADRAPTAEQRRRLGVADSDVVKYRRVELACGSRVLSVADNWYVASRLTAEMNRLLETTDTPFGTAVAPLEPTRETFLVRVLWTDSSQPAPDTILEHRAVLYTKDRQPFSEVDERYQRALIDVAPPRVDQHQHLFSAESAGRAPGFRPIDAEALVQFLDAAGIQRAAVFSVAYQFGNPNRPPVDHEYHHVRAENDWVSREVSRYPERLRAFCGLNPLKPYALDEIARCANDPLRFGDRRRTIAHRGMARVPRASADGNGVRHHRLQRRPYMR
jgi:hypothetical protein